MTTVVKIGGAIIEDKAALDAFCRDFNLLRGRKLLVHGGGPMAGDLQRRLGMEPLKIEVRRVTDDYTLKVVTMVYAGWCNKLIVTTLQACGCNALGLAGCDGSCVTAAKRPPRTLGDGSTVVDYGFVGDVQPSSIDAGFFRRLLEGGIVPVLCAINHDGRGQLLNTNADTVAGCLAAALGARLVCCFDRPGVLADPGDPGSVIPRLDIASYGALKAAGAVSDGMLPKLENAFAALRQGACEVWIKSSSGLLLQNGTQICL